MKKLEDYQFKYELLEDNSSLQVISLLTLNKLKTIPKTNKLGTVEYLEIWLNKMNFASLYKKRLNAINKKEPRVFDLVKNKEIKGVRLCNFKEKSGKEWIDSIRFELVYSDNTVIKIPELLYYLFETKLEVKNSNY